LAARFEGGGEHGPGANGGALGRLDHDYERTGPKCTWAGLTSGHAPFVGSDPCMNKSGILGNSLPELGEDPMVDVKGLEPLTSRV
jgi:hypothetical protein